MSLWEGNRGVGNFSGSEILVCPYDRSHLVRRSRFQYHIVKCALRHPKIKLEVCPYNASHRVPLEKLASHVAECPYKEELEILPSVDSQVTATSVSHSIALVSAENWDDEYPSTGNTSRASYIDEFAKYDTVGINDSQNVSTQSTGNFREKFMLNAFYPVQSQCPQANPNGKWLNLRLPKSLPSSLKGLGIGQRFGIEDMGGTNDSQNVSTQSTGNFHENSTLNAFYPVQSQCPQANPNEKWLNLRLPKSLPSSLKDFGIGRRFGIEDSES